MSELTLIERLADPELIHKMSTADKMTASLQVTLLGMGITFAVLILLWALIAIMAKALNKSEKKNPLAPVVTNTVAPAAAPAAISQEDDAELVAVITAAIAATLQKPLHSIIVKNIIRTPQNSLAWASVAKQEQLDSRRF